MTACCALSQKGCIPAAMPLLEIETKYEPGQELTELFSTYLGLRNINGQDAQFNLYQMASKLSLDLSDREVFNDP